MFHPLVYAWLGAALTRDSQWAVGDEAVGGRKDPSFRYDGGTANVSMGHEVKANLPGPLAHLGILPSDNAVQLVGPGATI